MAWVGNDQLLSMSNIKAGAGIEFARGTSGTKDEMVISVVSTFFDSKFALYQLKSEKNAANGFAGLNASTKLNSTQIDFNAAQFYLNGNMLCLKDETIVNPFTASGIDSSGIPTGLKLGNDAATIADVRPGDIVRMTVAVTDTINGVANQYPAQQEFRRTGMTNGSIRTDFYPLGAFVRNADGVSEGDNHLFLTPAERTKINGIAAGAEVNVIEAIKIGTTTLTVTGKAVTLPVATVTQDGLMSAADKAKLNGLGSQTQLDGKYVNKTGDTMTGNLIFPVGKGVNGSLVGIYPSSVSATNLNDLLMANTTFSYTFYYFPNTFTLTPGLIAKNVVLADSSNTMQTWNSGSGEGYQRAIIYPSSSNPLLKFYGDVWKEYLFREDLASSTQAGAMSAADKKKLDSVESGAQVNKLEVVKIGTEALPLQGKSVTLPAATQDKSGLQSAADKAKLDKINLFEGAFDFALAPTQGRLIIVLKNAPAVAPWNFHTEIEVQQFSGAPADRAEPARYVAEGHFAVGEYDLLVTGFPITAANGRYKDAGGRVWTHSTALQYQIKYVSGRWRILDGETILYSTHSDDGNPYGGVGSTDGSWVWCTGDTMTYLTGPKVVADKATIGSASWRSVNYNATSISNFLYAGKYTVNSVTYPALFLSGKFTQGKVIVRHLDYNATPAAASLELVSSITEDGAIQADAAKRWDAVPGNIEWEALTAQLIQSTNRGDGVRRSYNVTFPLGGSPSNSAWSLNNSNITLDIQNTPTDWAVDLSAQSSGTYTLTAANGVAGTHCLLTLRNNGTVTIGLTDGNGLTVYLAAGVSALARVVSASGSNKVEWISCGASSGSSIGQSPIPFTAAALSNGLLTISASSDPRAICKSDYSNVIHVAYTSRTAPVMGMSTYVINLAGLSLVGDWIVTF